ncbi:MAG: hypothetical protein J5736_03965 [Bacilli bacterium]|nr:hypothetical protein [Bacilli bacterium]
MKRKIGMQYFLPSAIYALVAGILTGIFLIFLQEEFTLFVMGLVALGILLLSVCFSLMGMVLLDLVKKPQRLGFLFQGIAYFLMGGVGVFYFFFRFSEPSSWSTVFFLIAFIGGSLGLLYCGRAMFTFWSFRAQEQLAKSFMEMEESQKPKQESQRVSFDSDNVVEVDAVDVDEEKGN